MDAVSLGEAAKHLVKNLRKTPHSPERALHLFRMIRASEVDSLPRLSIGELESRGVLDSPTQPHDVWKNVEDAAQFCQSHGV